MEKTKKSQQVYKGRMLNVFKDEIVQDDGRESVREFVTHPGGVCILGFVENKVVMERQFRYPYHKDILELPAGKLEKDEDPKDAAIREFEEETGYKVLEMVSLGELYPTVAYTNEVIHLYYASKLTEGNVHLDTDEKLDVELIELEKIVEMIRNNEIRDAKTIAVIYKYLDLIKK